MQASTISIKKAEYFDFRVQNTFGTYRIRLEGMTQIKNNTTKYSQY